MKRALFTILSVVILTVSMPITSQAAWVSLPGGIVWQEPNGEVITKTGVYWLDDNGDGIAEGYYLKNGVLMPNYADFEGVTFNEKGQWTEGGIIKTIPTATVQPNDIPLPSQLIPLFNAENGFEVKVDATKNNYVYLGENGTIQGLYQVYLFQLKYLGYVPVITNKLVPSILIAANVMTPDEKKVLAEVSYCNFEKQLGQSALDVVKK